MDGLTGKCHRAVAKQTKQNNKMGKLTHISLHRQVVHTGKWCYGVIASEANHSIHGASRVEYTSALSNELQYYTYTHCK